MSAPLYVYTHTVCTVYTHTVCTVYTHTVSTVYTHTVCNVFTHTVCTVYTDVLHFSVEGKKKRRLHSRANTQYVRVNE